MRRLRELVAEAGLETAGPMMARFYGDAAPGQDADLDVAIPVVPRADGSVPDAIGEARGEWLPLHHVLEAVHRGPHDQMDDAWAAVREACSALGYAPAGPVTEVYEVTRTDGVPPAVRHPGATPLRALTHAVTRGPSAPDHDGGPLFTCGTS